MRIPRIYTPQPLAAGATLTLEAEPSRHLALVLRLGAGDTVTLFNGDGRDYPARIETPARAGARLSVAAPGEPEPPPALPVTLALGVSKGERMDFALQKSVELGVEAIQPLFTERSVVRLRDERLQRRLQHWRRVIVAACEQSGRRCVPDLAEPLGLAPWLEQQPGGLLLDHRSEWTLPALPPPGSDGVTLLIGPEGGLAPRERDSARAHGFTGVRLGPRIMRTETAPIAAIAAIQALWGDFR